MLTRLRRALAAAAVLAALLAAAALSKQTTCGCSGSGLPYGTIALSASIAAVLALGAYVAAGLVARRE